MKKSTVGSTVLRARKGFGLAALVGLLVATGASPEARAGRRNAEDAARNQLALTRDAAELRRGLAAVEQERESLRYAMRLLEHRTDESLRRLGAYRVARGAREDQARVRARALYKMARGGLPRLYFEDLAPGVRTHASADRVTRGRTVRWLVRHDLRELEVHRRAERRAREELLAASREMAAVSALRMVEEIETRAYPHFEAELTPQLLAAARETKKASRGQKMFGLLARARKELRELERQRGFDLLEPRSLPRPVRGPVVGGFGRYIDKTLRVELERKGLELRARPGEKVEAIAEGTVAFVGALPGYDRVVVVDHGGGYLSLTGRLLEIEVSEGARVSGGDVLGHAAPAATQGSLGCTIYLELRHGERPIDPSDYLAKR